MKKLFALSLTALLLLGTVVSVAALRNNDDNNQPRQERVKMTPEQKAQTLTDRMAKAYDLSEDQKARLLELNKRALSPRHRQAPSANGDSPSKGKHHPGMRQGKGFRKGMMYMKGLKDIMTEEQFKAYCTDKGIERNIFGNGNAHKMQAPRGFQPRRDANRGYGHKPAMRPMGPGQRQAMRYHQAMRGQKGQQSSDARPMMCGNAPAGCPMQGAPMCKDKQKDCKNKARCAKDKCKKTKKCKKAKQSKQ